MRAALPLLCLLSIACGSVEAADTESADSTTPTEAASVAATESSSAPTAATAVATDALAATPAATAYVPRTKDDNTPWRFNMNQNGRRMTAAEFDAWMQAKGIHVATGKPAAAAPVALPEAPSAASVEAAPAPAASTCLPSAAPPC